MCRPDVVGPLRVQASMSLQKLCKAVTDPSLRGRMREEVAALLRLAGDSKEGSLVERNLAAGLTAIDQAEKHAVAAVQTQVRGGDEMLSYI
jgi:hypothetical protein